MVINFPPLKKTSIKNPVVKISHGSAESLLLRQLGCPGDLPLQIGKRSSSAF
jgi:hypothetical protein